MAWPIDDISTGDLDSGSDTPPRTTFFRMATVLKNIIANRGAAGGIASLDANSKVPDSQLGRGLANGVASLGANGKIPSAQIPLISGGLSGGVNAIAANYSVVAGDAGDTLEVSASAGARTISLPDLGDDAAGFTVTVVKSDNSANAVNVVAHGSDQIIGASIYKLEWEHETVILKWNGTSWLAIGGATGALLRDFLVRAGAVDITAVGQRVVTWDLMATKAVVILSGGGGGGGEAGGPGGRGSRGGDGADTTLLVSSATYTAEGGGGGGGGAGPTGDGSWGRNGGGQVWPTFPWAANYGGSGGGGSGAAGGVGATSSLYLSRDGGHGGAGELVLVKLAGLTRGTTLTLSIGAHGTAANDNRPPQHVARAATNGQGGYAIVIPDLAA